MAEGRSVLRLSELMTASTREDMTADYCTVNIAVPKPKDFDVLMLYGDDASTTRREMTR